MFAAFYTPYGALLRCVPSGSAFYAAYTMVLSGEDSENRCFFQKSGCLVMIVEKKSAAFY